MIDLDLNQFLLDKLLPYLPKYTRQDDNLWFRCPICGDSKKSKSKKRGHLYITPKIDYYCFNCGVYLSGFKFLKLLSGDSYADIMSEYNRLQLDSFNSYSINKKCDKSNETKQVITPPLTQLTDAELNYLANRKITNIHDFESLHLMNANIKGNDYIFIPWLKRGKLLNYQIHNWAKVKDIPKYRFQKGIDKPVYGLDNIDLSFKYVICFEGVFDSLFVKNGVAIGGKVLMPHQEREINDRYPAHQIVLAFDNDNAGLNAMKKIAMSDTSKYGYYIPDLQGCKDINEYVIKFNADIIKPNNADIKTGIELIAHYYN